MIGRLPDSITVSDKEYKLRTDYRNVLDTFIVFNDPDISMLEKWYIATYMLLEDFSCYEDLEEAIIDGFDLRECIKELSFFINAGEKEENKAEKPPLYDWEQDEQIIFSAVNNVARQEVREAEYIHWWTFLSYFNEIGEGLFSYVVGIRKKKQTGQKLDKAEQKFYREHKSMIDIKVRHTLEEQQFFAEISELL